MPHFAVSILPHLPFGARLGLVRGAGLSARPLARGSGGGLAGVPGEAG